MTKFEDSIRQILEISEKGSFKEKYEIRKQLRLMICKLQYVPREEGLLIQLKKLHDNIILE
jgi:hypothetical protein